MDLVSVIIPVGPKHTALVSEAVRSVELQTYGAHEIIIVNNSGQALAPLPPFPHVGIDSPRNNISLARNLGLEQASGRFVLFLDADDLLPPNALRILTDAYASFDAAYVYGDWYNVYADGSASYGQALTREKLLHGGIHPVSALVPTSIARAVGGFDEEYAGRWEDWEFWLRLAAHGHCGERVPEATLLYRRWTGTSFLTAHSEGDSLIVGLQARYRPYLTGDTAMCCGKSGNAARTKGTPTMALSDSPPTTQGGPGVTIMEYIGPKRGSFTRKINGNAYPVGNNNLNRYIEAQPDDVGSLMAFGDMRIVPGVKAVNVAEVLASVQRPAPTEAPEPNEDAETERAPEPAPEFDSLAIPEPPDPGVMAEMRQRLDAHSGAVLTNTIAPDAPAQAMRPNNKARR